MDKGWFSIDQILVKILNRGIKVMPEGLIPLGGSQLIEPTAMK